jgi:hypothetical protein
VFLPAYGLDCGKCGIKNHFARVCKNTRKVRTVVESPDSDTDDDSYQVSSVKSSKKCRSHVTVKVDNHPVAQVDSGADDSTIIQLTIIHLCK